MKDFLKVVFKVLSGAKLFLIIFFFGSSVFASSNQISYVDDEVHEKKDISVFVDKLSERLKGVLKEIIDLSVSTGDKNLFVASESSNEVQNFDEKILVDVKGHKYQDEILQMVDLGVIDSNREKFYPDNFLRKYEAVIILTKYRLVSNGQGLSSIVFPLRGWFFDVAQNESYAPYVAYAEQKGWIDQMILKKDDKKFFLPNKFLTKQEICNLIKLDSSDPFCNQDLIKRGEFVSILLRGFSNVDDEYNQNKVIENDKEQINSAMFQKARTMFSFVTKS